VKFFLRRAIFYVVTAFFAVTLNFFLPRMMPGDPVQAMLVRFQGQMSADAVDSLYVLFGLDSDTPLWQQYFQYWNQLFHGDLGLSFYQFPTPVIDIIKQCLPWTLLLVGVATIIAFLLGTVVGTFLGWRRGTLADAIIPLTTFFSALPYFWVALLLIALFGVKLDWLPFFGSYEPGLVPGWNAAFIGSVATHAVLPATTIVVSSIAGWILGMRNMMVTVSSEDYVTVAHAKGLRATTVMGGYAARNAILPQVSGFALSLGFVVGGTLVMEQVFSYQGIGFMLFRAVGAHDYPLMQGIFLVITLAVLVANIVADIVYAVLDPRVRKEG
jgi:peptide/nickel transport system permease protein